MAGGNGKQIDDNPVRDDGEDGSPPIIDPVTITESSAGNDGSGNADLGFLPNGQPRKRRRRTKEQIEADRAAGREPSRSIPSSGGAQKGGTLSVNSVQFSLTGIHALLAAGLAAPELEFTEQEAATVAQNIVAVSRHYDLQATAKAQDWGNLVVSLGIVYGGRIVRISARKKAERMARRAAAAGFEAVSNAVSPDGKVNPPANRGNGSRPKTDADLTLLNEHEAYIG